jgi:membrane protease YdiL (CAAX protease family)
MGAEVSLLIHKGGASPYARAMETGDTDNQQSSDLPADRSEGAAPRVWVTWVVTVGILVASWCAAWAAGSALGRPEDAGLGAAEPEPSVSAYAPYLAMALSTVVLVMLASGANSLRRLRVRAVDKDLIIPMCMAGLGIHFVTSYVFQYLHAMGGDDRSWSPVDGFLTPASGAADALYLSLVFGLCAGLSEELLFRGYFLGRLVQRWHPITAVVVAAFVFGLAHLSAARALSVMPLGAWLGYLTLRTNSVSNAIVVHFVTIVGITLHWWLYAATSSALVYFVVMVVVGALGITSAATLVRRWERSAAPPSAV